MCGVGGLVLHTGSRGYRAPVVATTKLPGGFRPRLGQDSASAHLLAAWSFPSWLWPAHAWARAFLSVNRWGLTLAGERHWNHEQPQAWRVSGNALGEKDLFGNWPSWEYLQGSLKGLYYNCIHQSDLQGCGMVWLIHKAVKRKPLGKWVLQTLYSLKDCLEGA